MINSPNVIRIKDWLKTTTKYYIALEFCNGGDLNNLRKAVGGYFQERDARMFLKQILDGLIAIKEQQVMHRDLKLDNILVHFPNMSENIELKTYI